MQNSVANAAYFHGGNQYIEGEQTSVCTIFDNLIWLTTEEAARFLRKSSHALRQMVYKGIIHPRKFHGRLYFKRSELHEQVDSSLF